VPAIFFNKRLGFRIHFRLDLIKGFLMGPKKRL
jgi:hypothetical protein